MHRTRFMISLFALAILSGCRGPETVSIRTDGMRFVRNEVSVRVGEPVTLRVINRDGYAHAFDIDAFDIHAPLAANEVYEVTITPDRIGRYDFYCGTPGHREAGMTGVLIVEP